MNCLNCGKPLRADLKFCPACGTTIARPASFGAPPSEPLRTSWGAGAAPAPPRKSRAGRILLVVFGLFLLLAAGAGIAVYYGVRYFANTIKSSEPYQLAEKTLRDSVVANGSLGGIKNIGFPIGAYATEADGSGKAAFTMSVEGSLATGQYVVMLERRGGVWHVVGAELRMSDGAVYNLLDDGESGGSGDAVTLGNEPPPPPSLKSEPVKVPGAISGGVLDAKAVSKPAPAYPAAARAVRATGTVTVQVTVDESGQVIMASAVSGHPLLRASAVAAARQARFSPTILKGRPVKVTGVLTYAFE